MAEQKRKCKMCGTVVDKKEAVAISRKVGSRRKRAYFCSFKCAKEFTESELSQPLEKQIENVSDVKPEVEVEIKKATEEAVEREKMHDMDYTVNKAEEERVDSVYDNKTQESAEYQIEIPSGHGAEGRAVNETYSKKVLERTDPRRQMNRADRETKGYDKVEEYRAKIVEAALSAEQKMYDEKMKKTGAKKK